MAREFERAGLRAAAVLQRFDELVRDYEKTVAIKALRERNVRNQSILSRGAPQLGEIHRAAGLPAPDVEYLRRTRPFGGARTVEIVLDDGTLDPFEWDKFPYAGSTLRHRESLSQEQIDAYQQAVGMALTYFRSPDASAGADNHSHCALSKPEEAVRARIATERPLILRFESTPTAALAQENHLKSDGDDGWRMSMHDPDEIIIRRLATKLSWD
eukprot:SAG31_NODE_14375_length_810_cov_1.448664_1_plen_213_part_10